MRNVPFLMTALLFAAGCTTDTSEEDFDIPSNLSVESSAGFSSELKSERHCLVHMEPGDTAGPAKLGEMTCYKSISETILVATDGRVSLPTATQPGEVTEDLLRSAGYDPDDMTIAAVLIGIDYLAPYYGGYSLTWAAPYGCYDPYTGASYFWYTNTMPPGWDNQVSSAQTFSYCRSTTVYDNAYLSGPGLTLGCDAPVMSWMDNRTSSQSWSPYGQCPWF